MKTTFIPKGVCSKEYNLEIENGIIKSISITGGCNGNLNGISRLITGQKAEDIIPLLKGTVCGKKPTSCPDQIAIALEEALKAEAAEKVASEKKYSSSMQFDMSKEFIYASYPSVRIENDPIHGVKSAEEVVIQPTYFDEFMYMLMQDGAHLALFGGTWSEKTQKVMGRINYFARKYNVDTVYNFDFRVDGETANANIKSDLTEQADYDGPGKRAVVGVADCNFLYGEMVTRYLTNLNEWTSKKIGCGDDITYLNLYYDPVTVPNLTEPFLFLYNKNNPAGPIVAALEFNSIPDEELDAKLENVIFNCIGKNGNNITPFTHQDYLYQAFKINGRGHSIKSEDCFKEGEQINLCPVPFQVIRWILHQKGAFMVAFAGAWCANTQAGIATINDFAVANETRVYMIDSRIEGKHQIDFWNYPRRSQLYLGHPAVRASYLDLWENCLPGAPILLSANPGKVFNPYVLDDEGNQHTVFGVDIPYLIAADKDHPGRGDRMRPVLGACNHDGFELINCVKSYIYYEPNYRKYTAGVYYVFSKYMDDIGGTVRYITINRTAPIQPGEVQKNNNVSGVKVEPKVHNWWAERGENATATETVNSNVISDAAEEEDCC